MKSSGSLIDKINCYLQIVANDPQSTTLIPLAEAFRQIGLLDDALAAARRGTETLPGFSSGFATLGLILAQMGQLDEARTAYERALVIDEQCLPAQLGMARLHLVRGERDLARQALQRALEFHPEDETAADLLLALDLPRPWSVPTAATLPAQAETEAVATVDEDEAPGSTPIPTATLAEIYVRQGLVDQAIKVYEEILRLEPANAAVRARLDALHAPAAGDRTTLPTAVVESPAAPSRREPLVVFEAWLEAISLRRAHVR